MPNPITSNVNSDNRIKSGRQPDNAKSQNRIKEALGDREAKWLAEASGLSPSSISDYIKGRSPRIDAALKIAKALDVDLEWLFGDQTELRRLDHAPRKGALVDANDADWVEVPEYLTYEIDELGKLAPVTTTLMRKDWLYASLGDTSGIWMARSPTRNDALGIDVGAMLFCKDYHPGERMVHGAYYLFRVNGGVILARYSLRDGNEGEETVSARDLGHEEDQHIAVARVIGEYARPL